MTRVFVHGQGAVSPAGWGMGPLRSALEHRCALPTQTLERPGWERPLRVRTVPAPTARLPFLAHARLRRASPMTHYAVGAALEAIGEDAAAIRAGTMRLGIITCTMTGGLSYSRRFYEEVLRNPGTASPLLFPETVFNAPASHLSAYLGAPIVNYTLVGDPGSFLQALAVGAQWLEDGTAEACVVIGAEEIDWTAADALRLFDRKSVLGTGAGALYVKGTPGDGVPVELSAVTDSWPDAKEMRAQLPEGAPDDLLCANQTPKTKAHAWPGDCLVPQAILGEAFAASAGWQCAAACGALRDGLYRAAQITITGGGWQATGAHFVNTNLLR